MFDHSRTALAVAAAILSVAVLGALFRGAVYLMPYQVRRRDNPQAFYFLLSIIVVALIATLAELFPELAHAAVGIAARLGGR